ncbi:hypothetical protein BVI1335_320138 [Burkholderia vietnamiensis]|nr:hypothetical protein BVI1335_320138 [Burkholderia vietnamiensis]
MLFRKALLHVRLLLRKRTLLDSGWPCLQGAGHRRGEGHAGNGMYCWLTEYPEEGAFFVDGSTAVPADVAPPAANEPAAIPIGYALVPIHRSYDMRTKALIAFNTTEQAGKDRDDALDAAHRATIEAAPRYPATSPSAEG